MRWFVPLFGLCLACLTLVLLFTRQQDAEPPWIVYQSDALYRIRPDGTERQEITPTTSQLIDWSADGAWIIGQNMFHVFRVHINGNIQESLNTDASSRFSVSEDWIAFAKSSRDGVSDFSRLSLDGQESLTLLTRGRNASNPVWSPDGEWLAYVSYVDSVGYQVFKIRSDGTENQHLGGQYRRFLAWSPDGEWLYFFGGDASLYRIRQDGTNLEKVLNDISRLGGFVWAPNGQWIYAIMDEHIFRLKPDGSDQQQLTEEAGAYRELSIAPTGTWLAFAELENGTSTVYRLPSEGGDIETVAEGEKPIWSPIVQHNNNFEWLLLASLGLASLALMFVRNPRVAL